MTILSSKQYATLFNQTLAYKSLKTHLQIYHQCYNEYNFHLTKVKGCYKSVDVKAGEVSRALEWSTIDASTSPPFYGSKDQRQNKCNTRVYREVHLKIEM